MSAHCENCTYFDQQSAPPKVGKDAGVCRFNPPVSQPEPEAHGLWPVVGEHDWCGHYAEAKGARH